MMMNNSRAIAFPSSTATRFIIASSAISFSSSKLARTNDSDFIVRRSPSLNGSDLIIGRPPALQSVNHRWERRSCVAGNARSGSSSATAWEGWWWNLRPPTANHPSDKAVTTTNTSSISDVLWPSAGAFLAMAVLGRLDQVMAPKGVSFTIAPLAAVCAVLFAAPNSPAAKKYNMFVAQIACAAFGVLALSVFGPGWLARSTALAASIAFMIITHATHPPAASLPILFIDGAKFHQLQFWYMLFPGATGCIILCVIQELVFYLKSNCRF